MQIRLTQDKMYQTIDIHISQIKHGDTVLHNGKVMTVCRNNIKYDKFVGYTLFGDSYKLGTIKVQKVIFNNGDKKRKYQNI